MIALLPTAFHQSLASKLMVLLSCVPQSNRFNFDFTIGNENKRRNIIMATREEKYIENLHDKFTTLLEKLMETESVDYENKTPILNDMKLMIDYYIRQLNNEL